MDAIVIFHFGLFLSFYPQTAQKMKIWHKWKIFLEMSSFYKSAPKTIIPFTNFIFHFRLFLAFFPLYLKKGKFQKNEDNVKRYYHFLQVYQKSWLYVSAIFCVFTTLTAQKMNFSKKWKKFQRYYHFMQVYQKTWSYDILFLGYATGQM